MSANVVKRLGLSVGRQLLVGARGRPLMGAVATGLPRGLEIRWFSSDSQPKYSKEYFDGVSKTWYFLHHLWYDAMNYAAGERQASCFVHEGRSFTTNGKTYRLKVDYFQSFFSFTVWIQSSSGANSQDARLVLNSMIGV